MAIGIYSKLRITRPVYVMSAHISLSFITQGSLVGHLFVSDFSSQYLPLDL